MRKIKFRAWIKSDKRMEKCVEINPFHIGDCDRLHWKHDEVEIMQYTGIKDKNEKDIYEGDIIQYDFMRAKIIYGFCGFDIEWITDRVAKIRQRKSEPMFHNTSIIFEVIGNIFENPDLLAIRD